jgi:HK97 family phage major capsid protein
LGGLRTYWVAEGGTLTESEPTFEQIKLVANKLGGYTQITAELEEDAEGISDLLMQLFAQGIAFAEDYAFLNGDGANQPLGVFNSPALISEAAGATTFVLSDAASMMEKFLPSRQSGVWLAHPFALHEFVEMADGSGASNNLIWLSNTREAPPITFFGQPVIFTEAMPVLPAAAAAANKGGVLLADFGYYYIGDRGGLRIDYSEHFAFTSDLGTWRFIKRVDGQPAVSQAMYLADGTNQVSPFVTLAGA